MKIKQCAHKSHHHSKTELFDQIIERLRSGGLRVTDQRKEIVQILLKSDRPLSAEELNKKMKKGDLVTVFRSLASIENLGLLQKQQLGDGIRRYEILTGHDHHHHYIHCRICGGVEPIEGCGFEKVILQELKKRGYSSIQHSMEIHAICAKCSKGL